MFLLRPFSLIWYLISTTRNTLYNIGLLDSVAFDLPIICVGNLCAGGSGKTTITEYLTRLLFKNNQVGVLSRGYMRKTRGYVLANHTSTAEEIGDEPLQIKKNFPTITVAVCEQRAIGVPTMLCDNPQMNLIIMDDGFQHRSVKPFINILLTEYHRPFYNDYLLPYGRLRESRNGVRRADAVIITKCPEHADFDKIKFKVWEYADESIPIFFSREVYKSPVNFFGNHVIIFPGTTGVTLSGIAHPEHFEKHCSSLVSIQKNFRFPDHYQFKESDLKKMNREFDEMKEKGKIIFTTRKDFMRLQHPGIINQVASLPLAIIPVEAEFIQEPDSPINFDNFIFNKLRQWKNE
ncbi:MAG: tetraacyldisaccharide 4'-kinase [Bacteroidetes bacterium RIFCSPLOWO2_02_FULL_36_8]|nr:MAG: tetraacyldisaccharide 4'-kinase [Bacteroidetes bacterium RIFCSPLOWO2_02_FULL_36_8]OFY69260.1 MAG: tetraacyldisaccharide 4'-kinase [Bacteroidetes bacterium RIFCSPLOWO2_12_FULL_37_12]